MDKKKLRPIVSLGMFDMYKGFAIFVVVYCHTIMYFSPFLPFISQIFRSVILYGFVIVAGYGLRRRPFKKCLIQIKNSYLIPYVYAAVFTPLLLLIVHFSLFHYLPGSVNEAFDVFKGFLLGQYPTIEYFGTRVYSVGPLWFVVAIAGGLILTNLILLISKDRTVRIALVILCAVIGTGVNKNFIIPYCFFHAFTFVPGLYLGSIARDKKLYERRFDWKMTVALVLSLVLMCMRFSERELYVTDRSYPLGPFSLFAGALASFFAVYLFVHINRRSNFIVNALEWLGHNSYYILCLHTIEYHGGCWYRIVETVNSPFLGFCIIFLLRSLFIAGGLFVIFKFKAWKAARQPVYS